MRIYTGGGDRGRTSLFSGERVTKHDARIETYGELDELNSVLGALAAALPSGQGELESEIERVQSDLLQAGAWLATTPDSPAQASLLEMTPHQIAGLEAAIDRMDAALDPLRGFILPGGCVSAGWAHVARTVCRRTERRVVALADAFASPPPAAELGEVPAPTERIQQARDQLGLIVVYLNRLSDYLFVLARHCNRLAGVPDRPWAP
jgi:cob(I)alamin adenosyltransferase